jgi:hypothetical protein
MSNGITEEVSCIYPVEQTDFNIPYSPKGGNRLNTENTLANICSDSLDKKPNHPKINHEESRNEGSALNDLLERLNKS